MKWYIELIKKSNYYESEHLLEEIDYIDRKKFVICHGDFDFSHIFSENDTYSGIIDFGSSVIATPCYDFACFISYEKREYLEYILQGYKKILPSFVLEDKELNF
jgi:aminoglycoside phosphotransferase (APT) family kinase protein